VNQQENISQVFLIKVDVFLVLQCAKYSTIASVPKKA